MHEPGSRIGRSVAAARAAVENLRPDELAAEIRRMPQLVLIDVRGAEEHRSGTIAGSVNVARGTLEWGVVARAEHESRIVVFCDTGERSSLAAASLYQMGFHDVAQLDGGLAAWRAAGHGIVAPGRG